MASEEGKRDETSESGGGKTRGMCSYNTEEGSGRMLSSKYRFSSEGKRSLRAPSSVLSDPSWSPSVDSTRHSTSGISMLP